MKTLFWIIAVAGCTKTESTECAEGTERDDQDRCVPAEVEDIAPIHIDSGSPDDSGESPPPVVDDTIVKLVAGIDHTCAHRADGLLECWGRSDLIASTPTFPVLDVTAQGWHTCVIDMDARLICWGDNEFGQSTFPTEGSYASLSAGVAHSCALDETGAIACWGVSEDDPLFGHGQVEKAPEGTGFHTMTSGKMHSCALNAANEVSCWGPDDGGIAQLHGDPVDVGQVTDAPAGNYAQIATDYWGGCALDTEGAIACWGARFYLPGDDFQDHRYTVIDGGGLHSCGIKTDGTLNCWGDDAHDQVSTTPEGTFVLLGVGEKHACAVDANNEVTCWGRDRYGEATAP